MIRTCCSNAEAINHGKRIAAWIPFLPQLLTCPPRWRSSLPVPVYYHYIYSSHDQSRGAAPIPIVYIESPGHFAQGREVCSIRSHDSAGADRALWFVSAAAAGCRSIASASSACTVSQAISSATSSSSQLYRSQSQLSEPPLEWGQGYLRTPIRPLAMPRCSSP